MPYRSRRQPYQKIKSAQTRFRKASTVRRVARRAAAQVINRIVETKSGVKSYTDGTQIYHNDFVVIEMLDKFNTERFTLVAQKFMKITTVR